MITSQTQIKIAYLDLYTSLVDLPSAIEITADLDIPQLIHQSAHILLQLASKHAFQILPPTPFGSYNPKTLPQSTVLTIPAEKRPGRPTNTMRIRNAAETFNHLEDWLLRTESGQLAAGVAPTPDMYLAKRGQFISMAGAEVVGSAEAQTADNLKNAEAIVLQAHGHVVVDSALRGGQLMSLVGTTSKTA